MTPDEARARLKIADPLLRYLRDGPGGDSFDDATEGAFGRYLDGVPEEPTRHYWQTKEWQDSVAADASEEPTT